MIDDVLFSPMRAPIRLRLRQGLFHAEVPTIGEIGCTTIEGKFAGIYQTKFKGFPYYALQIQDATNTFEVLFVPKASNLKDLVLSMMDEKVSDVYVEAYTDKDGRSRIRLYLDGKRALPHYFELPPIKRVRDGKGKPYYCLYDDRLKKIAEIIDLINKANNIQPARVEQHKQE